MKSYFDNDEIINNIRLLILKNTGLAFQDRNLSDVNKAVLERMNQCKISDLSNYYEIVSKHDGNNDEFRKLIDILTVNYSYFFRNEEQFLALKDKVLPEIVNLKREKFFKTGDCVNKPIIRILSVGCATGEEVYSIALACKLANIEDDTIGINIFGFDISQISIDFAKKGIFSEKSVKLIPKNLLNLFFNKIIDSSGKISYEVKDTLKEMVRFECRNVFEFDFLSNLFDIIFCRNVFIYFGQQKVKELIDKFYASLFDDGYIFFGYSENIQPFLKNFKICEYRNSIYYKKISKYSVEETSFDEDKFNDLSRTFKDDRSLSLDPLVLIENLLIEKKYYEALSIINDVIVKNALPLSLVYFKKAQILLNLGEYDQAKDYVEKSISLDKLYSPAHYLLGVIYFDYGLIDNAEQSLKDSLYLDKNFSLSSLLLANIYKIKGLNEKAKKQYQYTINLLSKLKPTDIIPLSGGFSAGALISICKENIEKLELML